MATPYIISLTNACTVNRNAYMQEEALAEACKMYIFSRCYARLWCPNKRHRRPLVPIFFMKISAPSPTTVAPNKVSHGWTAVKTSFVIITWCQIRCQEATWWPKGTMTPLVLTSVTIGAQETGWKLANPANQPETSLTCSVQLQGWWLPVTLGFLQYGAHRQETVLPDGCWWSSIISFPTRW